MVYILANRRNGALYVGVTSNLLQRIYQHREGVNDGFTKRYQINRLIWFESHDRMDSAIEREKRLKKWNRAWKIRLIEDANPDWRDLAVDLGFEPIRLKFETSQTRHPREGGGPSDEDAFRVDAGDGFPPSRE